MSDNTVNKSSCESMVSRINERLNKLETKQDRMETAMNAVDVKSSINEVILKDLKDAFNRNTDVINKVIGAIGNVEKSIVSMQSEIKNNAVTTNEIKQDFSDFKCKFEESEEKAKVDFRLVVKQVLSDKLVWLFGSVLTSGWIISKLLTNWDKISVLFK
jgi:predicted  nucleic acid-binding Zn-ribbon protein